MTEQKQERTLTVRQASVIAVFAAWGAFMGGLYASSQALTVVYAAVQGIFTIIFGVFVLAPLAGRHWRISFREWLMDVSKEAREEKQLVVLGLAHETRLMLEAERDLPKAKRPMSAAISAFMGVMTDAGEEAVQQGAASIGRLRSRLGGGAGGGDDLLSEVMAAKKAGLIDDKTAELATKASFLERFLDRMGSRGQRRRPPGTVHEIEVPQAGGFR